MTTYINNPVLYLRVVEVTPLRFDVRKCLFPGSADIQLKV